LSEESFVFMEFGHVSQIWSVGVVVLQHGARVGLNFGVPGGLPAEMVPSDGGRFDAGADGAVLHAAPDATLTPDENQDIAARAVAMARISDGARRRATKVGK
jgi:hypothetical protein